MASRISPGMMQTAAHACSAYSLLSVACYSAWLMASKSLDLKADYQHRLSPP